MFVTEVEKAVSSSKGTTGLHSSSRHDRKDQRQRETRRNRCQEVSKVESGASSGHWSALPRSRTPEIEVVRTDGGGVSL